MVPFPAHNFLLTWFFFRAVIISEFSRLHGFYVSKKSYLHQQQFMDLPIIVCPQLMPIFRFINDQNHPLIRGMAYNVSWIAMSSSKWSYQLCSNANKNNENVLEEWTSETCNVNYTKISKKNVWFFLFYYLNDVFSRHKALNTSKLRVWVVTFVILLTIQGRRHKQGSMKNTPE